MMSLRSDNLNFYGNWAGDWAIWGGGTYQINDKTAANVQISYDDGDNFAAVANVEYELVPGFRITPEVIYTDNLVTTMTTTMAMNSAASCASSATSNRHQVG